MSSLVIGSEGFVGHSFCRFLESRGEDVWRFDIKRGNHEDARQVSLGLDSSTHVYFLAWDVGGAKYLYREDVQFRQLEWNLSLLLNVMPQLQRAGSKFVFVSSQLAEETDTVYGVTKRLGEVWTRLLGGVRVRLWNVYGPTEEESDRSHVVSDFVRQAVGRGRVQMLTDGEEYRQFIHIDDVCTALALAQTQSLQEVYDITSFEWVKVRTVAETIAECAGAAVVPGAVRGVTPRTPLQGKIPGWQPQVDLKDGLARMVRSYASENELLGDSASR